MKTIAKIRFLKNSRQTANLKVKGDVVMKAMMRILISRLKWLLELAADRMGIAKYATTTNAWLFGSKGKIEKMVMYNRLDEQEIRTRPHHFNIKDATYWQGRFNRFKEFLKLGQSANFDLVDMFETQPPKQTLFNLMLSQMSEFWVGGPAPAPYVFTPGAVEVKIGNGTMPDARDVVFAPQSGGDLKITWDTALVFPTEHNDDVLQVMLITNDGSFGVWLPTCGAGVTRSTGTYTWAVPKNFLVPSTSLKAYCAVKFKAGAELAGRVKGIFKFPIGITPITLIP